jgi:hypothetical protein
MYGYLLRGLLGMVIAAYVIITLAAPSGAQPAGCTVVGITSREDEGFPLAHCADGSYVYQDMDGSATCEPAVCWVGPFYRIEGVK